MPLLQTRGAGSAKGLGLTASAAAVNYIEDVFSTYLYAGGTTTQTITNGIDLSTKGGMVWIKSRASTYNHSIWDSSRAGKYLFANTTDAETSAAYVNFLTTGFTVAAQDGFGYESPYGGPYVSWTFREQAKFFDVVTYTGTGSNTTIAHALGSVPGCIIVKKTNSTGQWCVYHRGLTSAAYGIFLNLTDAQTSDTALWNSTAPTSAVFSLGNSTGVNNLGDSYVAYIFAHDAGGFGLAGTDNVISCGSLTGSGAGIATTVTLGYEPQFILAKVTGAAQNWIMFDNMRGFDNTNAVRLFPNLSNAESTVPAANYFTPTATGFKYGPGNSMGDTANIIYIAIRRGPMKVPTLGTSVFSPIARTGTATTASVTAGFPVDMYLMQRRPTSSFPNIVDRLRGNTANIQTYQTDAETTTTNTVTGFDSMTAAIVGADTPGYVNESGITYANQMFRRAPSFFDEVCYTGTSPDLTLAHNLQAIPELMIIKQRGGVAGWAVFADLTSTTMRFGRLDTTGSVASQTYANHGFLTAQPTSSSFTLIGASGQLANNPGSTYVAYLFATCPGVSKVGLYTGTATTLQIDCGFTGGARFVLIKRTDSTGDWYVWDSARGIVAGNDPYLLLNSTAGEVTNTDYVDTYSAGFEISSTAPAAINASAGTFVFLAIA